MLKVQRLGVIYETRDGRIEAVRELDFEIHAGETLAIVGESGSGKTQSALALMGLLDRQAQVYGEALWKGVDLLKASNAELSKIRGREISMIFQDPMTALNPHLRIRTQMTEVLRHHYGLSENDAKSRCIEMLRAVRIPDPVRRIEQYPHEFSGGMRQRVMIAMALLCEPKLLIADEPTTALDVTVQAEILALLAELRARSGTALILITHDLGVVAGSCDRMIVMQGGMVVEQGQTAAIFSEAQQPYTQQLLAAVPRIPVLELAE